MTSRAIRLIEDTFNNRFDLNRYRTITRELFNVYEDKLFTNSGNIIPQGYKEDVALFGRLGTYSDPDGLQTDILYVKLRQATQLHRARSLQRNFIARHLKKREKEAALVAFYVDDHPDWRLSLVWRDEEIGFDEEKGKLTFDEILTPPRRSSYLLGVNEPSHTAKRQLLPLLQDGRHSPTLADLQAAFSVETVTKEFFNQYKTLFANLKEAVDGLVAADATIRADFAANEINTANFAKKLLGQIVFLYFLQKKGWLGVAQAGDWSSGAHQFLRRLFEGGYVAYDNFFNDVLEPLFYEALAEKRPSDWYATLNCKIPFLNGGLFEPMNGYAWQTTDLNLPNTLFSNDEQTKEGDIGTGVLDVFDRYNFTVREEEPLEQEVAVDPEMLGKVFENLLEVSDRKSKGAFYTPREIVHYMCQESLINYLDTQIGSFSKTRPERRTEFASRRNEPISLTRDDIALLIRQGELLVENDAAKNAGRKGGKYGLPQTVREQARALDEALAAVKVCDPAIGSGAFPVGMLTEIVKARGVLQRVGSLPAENSYNLKWHTIQKSIYGVDIDEGAVEIAKLRLWLSLVVDEESYDSIQPLPNLDYKIMAGNSLIELISPELLAGTADVERTRLTSALKKEKGALFDLTDIEEKKRKRLEIDDLVERLFENYKHYQIQLLQEKLDGLEAQLGMFADAKTKKFNKKIQALENEIREIENLQLPGASEHFEWHINFSEVFQENDGFDVVIGNPPYVRHERIKEQKPALKKMHPAVYQGTADLYVYFYSQGMKVLCQDGFLAFITGNKFMRAGYGKKLRHFLATKTTPQILIDFGDLPVFDATAYPCIVVTKNMSAPADNIVSALTVQTVSQIERITAVMAQEAWPMPQNKALTVDGWRLEPPEVLNLLEKLRDAGTPLGEYVNGRFYRGVLTGYNKAFVIDRATRDRLIAEHPSSAEIIKPFLRGKDVKRWAVGFAEQYLIKIESSQNAQHPWSGKTNQEAEKIFAQTYPAIHDHFQQHQQQLIKRYDQGNYFWELRACTYWQEFEQPKIAYPNICKRNEFAWDEECFYTNQKTFIIPNSSKYLLGVLNSSVVMWLFDKMLAKLQNGFYEPSAIFMGKFPIPAPSSPNPIDPLVTRILAAKKANPAANVAALEAEIDQLVYQLYGLSNEEIAIIEGT